ncbi:MAG TPA: ABC transporter ATP-binding protein [Nocardioides sp.]|jgi:oligopeptide/dipeptide ABC transporter ATP-binding protein|uniref:ABC transporter ATP-binding protein n=1 Tax=Nocardioides sp. TaxID=35761 RepID=UPI002CED8788|nr:ABC transporter ATP-binding protein [Nocardioides sp.]HTW17658.1 ABC transporter ATP-binding protein [Nocardioides sp.]
MIEHIPASPGPRVADNDVLLRVRGTRTEFGAGDQVVPAVNDVSFDLRRLERLGIVGESGSGKSALARTLMRLIEHPGRVVGGTIELDGRRLDQLDESEWRGVRGKDIAMVFQDPMSGFNPLRPIGKQIVEAITLHQDVSRAVAKRQAVDLLGDVEIVDPARKFGAYPHEFSGGMRQRAMIAMALANDPRILIADEPTTALDVTTQATILRLMRRLSDERGAALILISHDLGVVAQMCDTVQVMYAGKTVERGPALEVLVNPRHRYTEALLQSVVRRDQMVSGGRLPAIPGTPPNLRALPPGCPFEARCHVGRGRTDCSTETPRSSGFATQHGSVTVKCHVPAEPELVALSQGPDELRVDLGGCA